MFFSYFSNFASRSSIVWSYSLINSLIFLTSSEVSSSSDEPDWAESSSSAAFLSSADVDSSFLSSAAALAASGSSSFFSAAASSSATSSYFLDLFLEKKDLWATFDGIIMKAFYYEAQRAWLIYQAEIDEFDWA